MMTPYFNEFCQSRRILQKFHASIFFRQNKANQKGRSPKPHPFYGINLSHAGWWLLMSLFFSFSSSVVALCSRMEIWLVGSDWHLRKMCNCCKYHWGAPYRSLSKQWKFLSSRPCTVGRTPDQTQWQWLSQTQSHHRWYVPDFGKLRNG